MKDFNIAKYLKENYQGPFSMFQPYTDLNPLKEESEEQLDTTVPYKGPEPHLDGMGSDFHQANPVEEADSMIFDKGWQYDDEEEDDDIDPYDPNTEQGKFDRMMGLIDRTLEAHLPKLKKAVEKARQMGLKDMAIFNMLKTNSLTSPTVADLTDEGFNEQDIVDFFATDFSLEEDLTGDIRTDLEKTSGLSIADPIKLKDLSKELVQIADQMNPNLFQKEISMMKRLANYLVTNPDKAKAAIQNIDNSSFRGSEFYDDIFNTIDDVYPELLTIWDIPLGYNK